MTAGAEKAEIKIQHVVVVVSISDLRFAYSDLSVTHAFTGFQLWLFH